MQNAMIELIKQHNTNVLTSAQRLGELGMKTFEELTAKQTAIVNQYVESVTVHAEALNKVNDVKELVETQTAFSQDFGKKLVTNMRDYSELLNKAGGELVAISEEAVTNVTESAEKAGKLLQEAA